MFLFICALSVNRLLVLKCYISTFNFSGLCSDVCGYNLKKLSMLLCRYVVCLPLFAIQHRAKSDQGFSPSAAGLPAFL